MWGAYVNGFLCALFGYLYLRCECCRGCTWFGADKQSPTRRTTRTDSTLRTLPRMPGFWIDLADTRSVIILFSFLIGINEGLCLGSVLVSHLPSPIPRLFGVGDRLIMLGRRYIYHLCRSWRRPHVRPHSIVQVTGFRARSLLVRLLTLVGCSRTAVRPCLR